MNIRHGVFGIVLVAALAGATGCGAQSGPAVDGPEVTTAETQSPAATATSAEEGQAAEEVVITISEFDYELPESIAPGATVTVVNEDAVPHTVTAVDDGGFDADVPAGETTTFTAPEEPGEYEITCTYHPQMSGTLVVQ